MRVRMPAVAIACALPMLVAGLAAGQNPARAGVRMVSVRGVVFDSVRGRPLRDAFVTIVGGSQSTTTDSRGRFYFDSVPRGLRTFAVQHAELDSLGFTGLSARATLATGDEEVRVAVPSFATLWRAACGSASVPRDSGLVYGTIRDVRTRKPVANAGVRLSWSDLTVSRKKRIIDRRYKAEARTSANGDYVVCGVPLDASLHLRASTDSAQTGQLELPLAELRVQRRDLYVASGSRKGVVFGTLTDDAGAAFADARIILDDSSETVSDYDGGFVFRDAPTGSRRLEIRYIGMAPVITTVDIMPGDTSNVRLSMPRITTLATMHVMSPERASMLREEWEARKIMYHRHMIDSTVVGRYTDVATSLQGLPNVRVHRALNGTVNVTMPDGRGGSCVPELRVDGTMVNDFSQLSSIPPNRVVGMEVYQHAMDIPPEFMRGGVMYRCGLVAVWTKWAFRLP